jgi:hypothetical protein
MLFPSSDAFNSGNCRPRDEGQERQRETVILLENGLVALAHPGDIRHIHAMHRGDVR